jgi:predicted porin
MNKKSMALAVAGALAAPGWAVAQTSVTPTQIVAPVGIASSGGITLYGRLDETIMSNDYSESGNKLIGKVKKGDVYAPGNAMGIRGREDLGGGTSAWFQLEIGVWPDGRLETSAVTGNNWGGRNSAIGVSSGIGDILVGIWDTPYKQTFGVWNSITSGGFSAAGITVGNGDTTGALNNALCTNTVSNTSGAIPAAGAPAQNVCVTEATANGTAWSRRINNSVQWWSPVWSGFQVKLMTAMANYQSPGTAQFPSGLPKAKEYSASAAWVRGPLSIGLGYDYHEGLRPGTGAGQNANPKDNAVMLGAKWNFGPGEIGVAYEQLKYGENGTSTTPAGKMDVPSYAVNARWNIGPGAVWGSYAAADAKSCSTTTTTIGSAACGVKPKMYVLGYDYVLSKRTKLYAAYAKIDNGVVTNAAGAVVAGSNYYYIAGPAGNNGGGGNVGNGTASGIAAGTDVTSIGLGIQHVF